MKFNEMMPVLIERKRTIEDIFNSLGHPALIMI